MYYIRKFPLKEYGKRRENHKSTSHDKEREKAQLSRSSSKKTKIKYNK